MLGFPQVGQIGVLSLKVRIREHSIQLKTDYPKFGSANAQGRRLRRWHVGTRE
jgi:hypothetical protein